MPASTLKALTPMIKSPDVERSRSFYRDVLGFSCTGDYAPEGTPVWCSMRRGGADVMITKCSDAEAAESRARRDVVLYIYTDDAPAERDAIKARGVDVSDLFVTFYHMKEFTLRDPDGYEIIFGQGADEAPFGCE